MHRAPDRLMITPIVCSFFLKRMITTVAPRPLLPAVLLVYRRDESEQPSRSPYRQQDQGRSHARGLSAVILRSSTLPNNDMRPGDFPHGLPYHFPGSISTCWKKAGDFGFLRGIVRASALILGRHRHGLMINPWSPVPGFQQPLNCPQSALFWAPGQNVKKENASGYRFCHPARHHGVPSLQVFYHF